MDTAGSYSSWLFLKERTWLTASNFQVQKLQQLYSRAHQQNIHKIWWLPEYWELLEENTKEMRSVI